MSRSRPTSEVRRLLQDLVAIDSVNPDLVSGGAGERGIAEYVADWLRQRGLDAEVIDSNGTGRPNVVGHVRGRGGGRTLLLNGHLDTVGTNEMPGALSPMVRGGRLYGRGSSDMKGGLAAIMLAAADAVLLELAGDVIFAGVADEEYRSIGSDAVAPLVQADGAIVAEPTGLRLGLAHKGFVWLEVETLGVAAHGSRPDLGVDAIAMMGRVLVGLDELASRLAASPGHRLLGPGSVHASLIDGGHEVSTYPASCRLTVERRTVPGETRQDVLAEGRQILDAIRADDPSFRAEVRVTFDRPPLEVREDVGVVRSLVRQFEAVARKSPEVAGMSYWTDAAIFAAHGVPTIVFGPLGEGDHSASEWVDLASVELCRRVIAAAAADFCG